jgi:hypothetical protein
MNPDSPGDERHRAGLLRSPRSSAPIPGVPRRSCGQLRLRSLRRSVSYRLCMEASESKPDTPGIYRDPAEVRTASCEPALSVSQAGRGATAHSGVMAHFS